MTRMNVDLGLVQKYNLAAPRYTSYPPATSFTSAVAWSDVAADLLSNNSPEQDLSLYFHIPFCETLCWYCGCTTVITTQHNQGDTYLTYLAKEMQQMASVLNRSRRVVQLHFGGGTPTFLAPDRLRKLGAMIRSHFDLPEDMEAGVELDPRRLSFDHLAALREVGFNRASLGVQDFNPAVQQAIHRIQPFDRTRTVVDWIRSAGFQSLNIDLMYGLPGQSMDSFKETLDLALSLSPDRFAVFNYAHVPWLKPAQKILEKALPAPETKLQLLKLGIERLTAAGYEYIGMDHFARPDDELAVAQRNGTLQRNFQGYSTRGGADICAFGVSAISQSPNLYWQNHKDLKAYYEALDESKAPIAKGYIMTEDDRIRRETIMRLMCDLSLNYAGMSARQGIDFTRYFGVELESLGDLDADGLICIGAEGLEVTKAGRLFVRNIAMKFDATQNKASRPQFSKTI